MGKISNNVTIIFLNLFKHLQSRYAYYNMNQYRRLALQENKMKHLTLIISTLSLPLLFTGKLLARNHLQTQYYKKLDQRRIGNIKPLGHEHIHTEKETARTGIMEVKRPVYPVKKTVTFDNTKEFINTVAITHKELIHEDLFNEAFGLYGSGKIKFSKDMRTARFMSHPVYLSPTYGALIAYTAYAIYRSMILAGDITTDEPFHIIELGSGNGTLAHDILHFIEYAAKEEKKYAYKTDWQTFFNTITYVSGDISPALVAIQKRKNKTYIDREKIKVLQVNARSITKHFLKHKIKGIILSNNMLAAFPEHKVIKQKDNLNVVAAITTCNKKDIEVLFGDKNTIKTILKKNNDIRQTYKEILPKDLNPNKIILSKKRYVDLTKTLTLQNKAIDIYTTS